MAEPGPEETLAEGVRQLREQGYLADFAVRRDGRVEHVGAAHIHQPGELIVEATLRFEGVSDPDDEAVIFGLRCGECGERGILIAAYGPAASAEEATVVASLAGRSAKK